ncbi:MAG: Y-family DNA polymerase [Lachnospiraceae bacterium]|nr:Y-family DNA polymerase [Lachnospiraceae bacterium]
MGTFIAIDLKSFYASVECVDRGLDPLTTNLVVADESRTEKTICLAVSPSLKAYGIPGRARLFEVIAKTRGKNIEYIVAPPRMARYMEVSSQIYDIYLKYVAADDMHIYSVDEVFLDVTHYGNIYKMSPHDMAMMMIRDVLESTGITATAGIGTNMYLAKIAMDIEAKHMPADENGVRIAELDEMSYRKNLWSHTPITDFWRVGRGYAKKLASKGMYTMGDVARCSLGDEGDYHNEDLLYKMFGVNAELLIDHAWGYEPCTMKDIKSYRPEANSQSIGQVLTEPYTCDKARIIIREMTDELSLRLHEKKLVTDQLVLTVGYDIENLKDPDRAKKYTGEITVDHYGRLVPKHAHGTMNLGGFTNSTTQMVQKMVELYDRIIDPELLVRRMYVVAGRVMYESEVKRRTAEYDQLSFFDKNGQFIADTDSPQKEEQADERERAIQDAVLKIKNRYGKNAILKGTSYTEGATGRERNSQIGGHKA